MSYSEAELATARQEVTAFCMREKQDYMMNEVVEGRSSIYPIATELLNPIYFEVDETGEFARNLGVFVNRMICFEETRRQTGLVINSPLTVILFEKAHRESEGRELKAVRRFCRQFIVSQLAVSCPKKAVANLLTIMLNAKTETELQQAKQMLIEIITETEATMERMDEKNRPSAEICRTLNSILFRSLCSTEFTDAAIEIIAVVSEHTDNAHWILSGMAKGLKNPKEWKRSEDLLIRFGTIANGFGTACTFMRRAIVSDDEDVRHRANRILVAVAEARCTNEKAYKREIPFLMEILKPIIAILPDGQRAREAYIETACATKYTERAAGLLFWALETEDLFADAQITLIEFADRDHNIARIIGIKCYKCFRTADLEKKRSGRFNVATPDEYCNRLIETAKRFIQDSRDWKLFVEGASEGFRNEPAGVGEKTVAFFERVVDSLDEPGQDMLIKRLAIGFADEKETDGTAQFFDRLMARNGNYRKLAVHAITRELFGFQGQMIKDFESRMNRYLEQRSEVANWVTAHLIELIKKKPEERGQLVSYMGSPHDEVRRIATIAHNLSAGKIGTTHVPRRAEARGPVGVQGSANGRIHT